MDAAFASPLLGPLLIFSLRIVDVSCDTMRVLFAIRGRRGIAALLGFAQAFIWIFAVGNAVKHLDSVWHILGYASGYAMGTFVGITIERAVAYGMATVRIVSKHGGVEIAEALRNLGYGVTEMAGFGREGGVEIHQGPESHENGKFAWIMDPDGNKVELWEPMIWDDKNKVSS